MKLYFEDIIAILIVLVAGITIVFAIIFGTTIHQDSSAAQQKQVKVAAVGDSITVGVGVGSENFDTLSYPAQLQTLLGNRYQVANYGMSGRTLLDTSDQPYVYENAYQESMLYGPDIVLIMLGTNDSKSKFWNAVEYKKQLIAFVNTYKSQPNDPIVFLMTPPSVYDSSNGINEDSVNETTITNEVVPIVKLVASTTNTPLIDIYGATLGRPGLFSDGVHPDSAGYRLIADTVFKAIQFTMTDRRK